MSDLPIVVHDDNLVEQQPEPELPDKRWGFIEDGEFIEVPKLPLQNANLKPPCDIPTYTGMRSIIEKP